MVVTKLKMTFTMSMQTKPVLKLTTGATVSTDDDLWDYQLWPLRMLTQLRSAISSFYISAIK